MRRVLRALLETRGFEVSEASNGQIAQELLENGAFDIVISDIQMPVMNGIELLKWTKAHKKVPVVLMTGFSQILETQQAFEMGAEEFLLKPFKSRQVSEIVDKILRPRRANAAPESEADPGFCRVPIEDFVSDDTCKVNVYVRLSDEKFIRVSHKGDRIPPDRLENYKQKGLNYLYVRKEDLAQVVGFNLGLSRVIMGDARVPIEKKAAFLRYTAETVLEQVSVAGISEDAFKTAKDCVDSCLALVSESDRLFNLLEALNSHASWIYAHSFGVGLYSAMIGRHLGWASSANIFKVAMAGLFHDIGKKELAPQLVEKPRALLTHEERALYETHPTRSREILLSMKEVPSDVVQIAYEHHENAVGTGFPRRLNKHRIHPLAKVVALANRFCTVALKSPHSDGCDALEAVLRLEAQGDELDLPSLNALRRCCN